MACTTYKFTAERRQRYLEHLEHGAGRHAAARAVGVSPSAVWRHAQSDPEFAEQIVEAEQLFLDSIEHALNEKAAAGDVRALVAVLAAKRPEVWSQQRRVSITSTSTITTREERAYSPAEQLAIGEGLVRAGAWSHAALDRLREFLVESGALPAPELVVLQVAEPGVIEARAVEAS